MDDELRRRRRGCATSGSLTTERSSSSTRRGDWRPPPPEGWRCGGNSEEPGRSMVPPPPPAWWCTGPTCTCRKRGDSRGCWRAAATGGGGDAPTLPTPGRSSPSSVEREGEKYGVGDEGPAIPPPPLGGRAADDDHEEDEGDAVGGVGGLCADVPFGKYDVLPSALGEEGGEGRDGTPGAADPSARTTSRAWDVASAGAEGSRVCGWNCRPRCCSPARRRLLRSREDDAVEFIDRFLLLVVFLIIPFVAFLAGCWKDDVKALLNSSHSRVPRRSPWLSCSSTLAVFGLAWKRLLRQAAATTTTDSSQPHSVSIFSGQPAREFLLGCCFSLLLWGSQLTPVLCAVFWSVWKVACA